MLRAALRSTLLLTILFSLNSCGDDPALVKKREEQKTEIARLEGEIAILDEKLKALPPDRSNELADARKKAEIQTKDIENLEQEIADLETKKRTLEAEIEAYKEKYPVNR